MLFAGGPRWWGAVVSAASPIALGSSSGSLTLTLDENGVGGWCHVHLLVSGICTPLGAEALKYIAAHLASFLAETSPGQRWVLSLSELHTSVYGQHVAGQVILDLQDANGTRFAKLMLTPAEKSQWMQDLSQHAGT